MDVDLTLLRNHILGYDVQISERLVHEGGDIISSLEYLGVFVLVDEVEQLLEDLFDVRYLV